MKMLHHARTVLLVASFLAVGGAFAASQGAFDEQMAADGLQKVKVKNIDLVYAQPGATFADYDSVLIDPRVDVTFRKDFDPTKVGSRMKLSTEDLNEIRTDVAKAVYEEFVEELTTKKGTYGLADKAGPKVLDVRLAIANLYSNAPDTMQPGRTRVYTVSAGEMTLVMELRDSETGAVLARVFDRREARDTGQFMLTNSATNAAEVRRMAGSWAKIMRERMDAAHGIGKR
jgi:hypothetical protein